MKDVKVPDHVKNLPKSVTDENSAPSMEVLSFNLNQQFLHGADKKKLGGEVEIVVLGVSPPKNFVNHRAWWTKDIKDEEAGGPPDCSSPDGVRPHDWIKDPQASQCANCAKNVKGSAKSGMGKDCHQSKQILFAWPEDVRGGLNRFKAPASSLKSLCDHIYDVNSSLGAPISSVVTGIRFNKDSEWTQPEFFFVKFLPNEDMDYASNLAVSPEIAKLSGGAGAIQIEDKSRVAAAVTQEEEAPDGGDYTPPETSETGSFIDDLFAAPGEAPVVEANEECKVAAPYGALLAEINNAASQKDLEKIWVDSMDLMRELSKDQEMTVKKAIGEAVERIKGSIQPEAVTEEDPWDKINNKKYLPDLLKALKEKGPESMAKNKVAFVQKASVLNGIEWNPVDFGVSKDGYPALCKDGSFTKSKKGKKVETPEVPEDVMDALASV